MAKLTTIEGIGDALSAKLKSGGVGSTATLLRMGATKQGRKQISDRCGIDEQRVLRFVNHADLMRVKGIGGEYAELLEAAGVDSVPELKNRNATNLAASLSEVNGKRSLVRFVPSEKMVTSWVTQAKSLDRIVTH